MVDSEWRQLLKNVKNPDSNTPSTCVRLHSLSISHLMKHIFYVTLVRNVYLLRLKCKVTWKRKSVLAYKPGGGKERATKRYKENRGVV